MAGMVHGKGLPDGFLGNLKVKAAMVAYHLEKKYRRR